MSAKLPIRPAGYTHSTPTTASYPLGVMTGTKDLMVSFKESARDSCCSRTECTSHARKTMGRNSFNILGQCGVGWGGALLSAPPSGAGEEDASAAAPDEPARRPVDRWQRDPVLPEAAELPAADARALNSATTDYDVTATTDGDKVSTEGMAAEGAE